MGVEEVPTVEVAGGMIRLGQFLKLAGLAESGAAARELIGDGDVRVDGETETRRGRQLATGALVQVARSDGIAAARVG